MKASTLMLWAVAAAVLGKWAHNKPTGGVNTVFEAVFAIMVVSFLDQGKTEPIAKGFAWLFLSAVLLSPDSILTGLGQISGTTAKGKIQTGNPSNTPTKSV